MKTIKFNQNGTGRYDDVSPFILADGKLEIKIALPQLSGEFFFIAENNGKQFKKVIPQDGVIALDGLTAGELTAEVKHYLKGVLIKNYKVEPLILREVDGSLSATPEFIELQAVISALKAELAALAHTVAQEKQAAEKRTEVLNEWSAHVNIKLDALMNFAYDDYSKNVYLSGGDVEQFCKEYGFETKEEKFITGGKDNEN